MFDKAQTRLIQSPGGLSGSYTIPNSVTNIGFDAFYYCYGPTNVTIPDSVTNIVDNAFQDCIGLTSVTIGNSVSNLGELAFAFCSGLTNAYFRGNAPPDVGNPFLFTPATVNYRPGTTGWGPTFGGAPTALWNPQSLSLGFTAGRGGVICQPGIMMAIQTTLRLLGRKEEAMNVGRKAQEHFRASVTNPGVLIFGKSGSGKSTFARRVVTQHGLEP